jgi:membrane-associated HD superfamily phosphohydrolase
MTMHRLFDDRVRPYSLIDVKTNFKESSYAKLFLYEFLLNMLSYMNYVCIHSDNCLFSWAQVLWHLHRAEILQDHHCIVLTRVNFCCLLWLCSFRLNTLVVLMMLFTVAEHMNIFSFVFHFLSTSLLHNQHQLNVNCLTVTILLCCFPSKLISTYQSQISIMTSVGFICVLCVILTLASELCSQWCSWLWKCVASFSVPVTSAKCACVHQQVERLLTIISKDILTQSTKNQLKVHSKLNDLTQSEAKPFCSFTVYVHWC